MFQITQILRWEWLLLWEYWKQKNRDMFRFLILFSPDRQEQSVWKGMTEMIKLNVPRGKVKVWTYKCEHESVKVKVWERQARPVGVKGNDGDDKAEFPSKAS